VCVPAPYLQQCQDVLLTGTPVAWGAQDVSAHAGGAYTGEVCASMLADFACRYVIVGHSERRAYHRESSELVAKEGAGGPERGHDPDRLRRRNAGAARGGQTFVVGASWAPCWNCWSGAGGADRRGLRTCLGDRHRQDRDAGDGAGSARACARSCAEQNASVAAACRFCTAAA
jgi:hypothetical protein